MTGKINILIIKYIIENALFELGQVVVTPGAVDLLDRSGTNLNRLLHRHQFGDWGDICVSDMHVNSMAVHNGERVLSTYELGPRKERIWIITEWDRSVTTALLPEEY